MANRAALTAVCTFLLTTLVGCGSQGAETGDVLASDVSDASFSDGMSPAAVAQPVTTSVRDDAAEVTTIADVSEDYTVLPFVGGQETGATDGVFFDGAGLLDESFLLLQELKEASKQTFERLNVGYAEGTVEQSVLLCSEFAQNSVLYKFACNDESDSTLLTDYGFPLFLITVAEPARCAALPPGAFNDVDCQINAFNFLTDSGHYGFYRSLRTEGDVVRESLTLSMDNIPPYVDASFVPDTCVLEIYQEGAVLVNDPDTCSVSVSSLLSEFRI